MDSEGELHDEPSEDAESDSEESDASDSEESDAGRDAEIAALQESVAAGMASSTDLLRLISLLKAEAELDGVRAARERLAALRCPLDAAVWLEWIADEERLAETDEECEALRQLCLRACGDHLSVDLWLRYVHVVGRALVPDLLPDEAADPAADLDTQDGGGPDAAPPPLPAAASAATAELRAAFEAAATACGLHVAEGGRLWSTWEAFELRLLRATRAAAAADGPSPADQVNRVRALYRRHLSLPLEGIEAAHRRYLAWEKAEGRGAKEAVDAAFGRAYDEASRQLVRRRKLELRLASCRAAGGRSSDPWARDEGGSWSIWAECGGGHLELLPQHLELLPQHLDSSLGGSRLTTAGASQVPC